jgi:MFS family permease
MWTILKDRRIAYLVIANILSSVGSGVTMIGVPWLLINRSGGDEIYGYVTLASTVVIFLFSPYIGAFIDQFSRKKMLLASEVAGGSITLLFALWGLITGHYEMWQLIAVYFAGSLYYSVHFPTQFAFTQEIFSKEQYKAIISILEVQNQSASMIAGGLASLMIDHVNFSWVLLADALTYFIGFVLFLLIPYVPSKPVHTGPAASLWGNVIEGFRYMKESKLLTVFLFCALIPFICVMVGNYIHPVYISSVLHGGANVLGASDMIYAIGAVLAGLTVPLLMRRFGSYRTILITFTMFTLSMVCIYLFPFIGIFLAVKTLNGWGNAGTRVVRNTLMMETIPNHLIGRVNSFFNAMGMGMRVLFIGASTQIIAYLGARTAMLLLVVLLFFCFAGVIAGSKLFAIKSDAKSNALSS